MKKVIIKTFILVIYATVNSCLVASTESDPNAAWIPRPGDHVLLTKEYAPAGSGKVKEKRISSFWCLRDDWEAQSVVYSLNEMSETLDISDAIDLAKDHYEAWASEAVDSERTHCEYILVPTEGGVSLDTGFRFFYYVHLYPETQWHIGTGFVVLADGQVRRPMFTSTKGVNFRWDDQRE